MIPIGLFQTDVQCSSSSDPLRGGHSGATAAGGLTREDVLGAQRQKYMSVVAKTLHKDQSWFHGAIEREAADLIMLESGHQDGKFLYVFV